MINDPSLPKTESRDLGLSVLKLGKPQVNEKKKVTLTPDLLSNKAQNRKVKLFSLYHILGLNFLGP